MYRAMSFHVMIERGHTAAEPAGRRIRVVLSEIERTGTYTHTLDELTFGARVAWRNAARCIGRLYWRSLRVRDRRTVAAPGRSSAAMPKRVIGPPR